jgi:hypothetical protein
MKGLKWSGLCLAGALIWSGCSDGGKVVTAGGGATGVVGIHGMALMPDGKPAYGAEVSLLPINYLKPSPLAAGAKWGAYASKTIVDGQGQYHFDGVDTGQYTVEVKSNPALTQRNGAWFSLHADGHEPIVRLSKHTLEPVGGIEGVLSLPGSGAISGFVQIYGIDRLGTCDSLGRFSFTDLPPGNFNLRILSLSQAALPTVLKQVEVISASTRNLGTLSVTPSSLVLDGFESDSVRSIVYPGENNVTRALWKMAQPPQDSGPSIYSLDAQTGTRSLRVRFGSDSSRFHFHPVGGIPPIWNSVHDYLLTPSKWQANTYNRMRFWIKMPVAIPRGEPGHSNLQFSFYIRKSNGNVLSPTDGGGLWHHQFNIPSTGEWHQVILDTHPGQKSGENGDVESGNLLHPTGEPDYNYFDLATGFFVSITGGTNLPAAVLFDGFEIFHDLDNESAEEVYSLHGVFVPATNEIIVGWNRNKDAPGPHEVRYAYQSIHDLGWDGAFQAPNGLITPPATGGFNTMDWSTRAIDLAGKQTVFIAIKPVGSQSFREISLPVVNK